MTVTFKQIINDSYRDSPLKKRLAAAYALAAPSPMPWTAAVKDVREGARLEDPGKIVAKLKELAETCGTGPEFAPAVEELRQHYRQWQKIVKHFDKMGSSTSSAGEQAGETTAGAGNELQQQQVKTEKAKEHLAKVSPQIEQLKNMLLQLGADVRESSCESVTDEESLTDEEVLSLFEQTPSVFGLVKRGTSLVEIAEEAKSRKKQLNQIAEKAVEEAAVGGGPAEGEAAGAVGAGVLDLDDQIAEHIRDACKDPARKDPRFLLVYSDKKCFYGLRIISMSARAWEGNS